MAGVQGKRNSLLSFVAAVIFAVVVCSHTTRAQLSSTFYDSSCPNLQSIVKSVLDNALLSDFRAGASLLRLHFHDCFVQGCDGSILLDDTGSFTGEKGAGPNAGSLRGFNVIDSIKAAVEANCAGTVSCADILAIAARDGVVAAGGPSWTVQLGRRDSTTADLNSANNLPSPNSNVATLLGKFGAQGLNGNDMVALAGAHTFGKARCLFITARLYNFQGTGQADPTINPTLLASLQAACPNGGNGNALVDLDQSTPGRFDSSYYSNLLANKGLLESDQALESEGGPSANVVGNFASSQGQFFAQFASSVVKMGNISPLTGTSGTIRTNCRVAN